MSYKEEFSNHFELGFNLDKFPVKLFDRSYRNDICPSFYFNIKNQFFILWTDYKEKDLRDEPESKRYTLVYGINEGDNEYKEICTDYDKEPILSSDNILQIEDLIRDLGKNI